MMKFRVRVIHPQLGEFIGETMEGSPDEYVGLRDAIKGAFIQEFYELYLNNGSYLSIPKNVMRECMVLVDIVEDIEED